jgi:hypothetical protein
MSIGTACQDGPCPATLLGFPIQLCSTDAECFNAGEKCGMINIAALMMMIPACVKPDGGTVEGGTHDGGDAGDGGSSSGGDSGDGGSDTGPQDAGDGG